LPAASRPKLVRGDNAFGNEAMMAALEVRQQPYLFKLKLSKNVKRHSVACLLSRAGVMPARAGKAWRGSCP
jgi:hypothetical protein